MSDIASTLNNLERTVLPIISLNKNCDVSFLTKESGLKDIEVKRSLQWLENKSLISTKSEVKTFIYLDSNGVKYLKLGLPEKRALKIISSKKSVSSDNLLKEGLEKNEINIIIGTLKKKAAITISKEGKNLVLSITNQGNKLLDKNSLEELFLKKSFPLNINDLSPEEKFAYNNLRSRKNILKTEKTTVLSASISSKGSDLVKKGLSKSSGIDRITPLIIKSKIWKKKSIRAFDVGVNVPQISRGKTHFVNEAINYVKRIWLDLGFTEMTGDHVQTAFWDLDSLFVPQDHPAREMQDTFYLTKPRVGSIPQKKLFSKVKSVHVDGGDTGSLGWRTNFDKGASLLNLLRTHTTVLSAKTLSSLKESDLPAKFFAVGKVYRNESLDWKHLFEFHQVEGIIVDKNANLRHLKGYLEEFYKKMGFSKVRMRPAHFPYTEISIEPEVWHPEKKEWVEVGGAGIFRPEVTKTLLGVEIPVLAFGLGLERIISPYYNITDIRKLYDNDLKFLREVKSFIK